MRPSYDGEHPIAPTPTPIYDELYSEYRRLFRALPGDRAGEEDMRFTGFAIRERPFGGSGGGSAGGSAGGDSYRDGYGAVPQHPAFTGYPGQLTGAPQFVPAQHVPQQQPSQQPAHQQHAPHQPAAQHPYQASPYPHPQQPSTTGQGWVAAGYLTPTAPAPAAPGPATPGRHRGNLLSLPPGRS
ncbi:hypothetical protein ABH930_002716 [Kitasatospora sp. GAS204A]|uniref:hypothetical protein n=1 Tax=unclassified Kitasatospora TaxID=2633591 RepID=UPI002473E07F|nr:hypothetical protein [Kitasatospora sp. GAS204B]MDH6118985.1 hypothetical protein [Kitasatospora sp. GAS204B]